MEVREKVLSEINLDRNQNLELERIAVGACYPLSGFMNEDDFNSVVEHMRLSDGSVFTIPIVLDLTQDDATRLRGDHELHSFMKEKKLEKSNPLAHGPSRVPDSMPVFPAPI